MIVAVLFIIALLLVALLYDLARFHRLLVKLLGAMTTDITEAVRKSHESADQEIHLQRFEHANADRDERAQKDLREFEKDQRQRPTVLPAATVRPDAP